MQIDLNAYLKSIAQELLEDGFDEKWLQSLLLEKDLSEQIKNKEAITLLGKEHFNRLIKEVICTELAAKGELVTTALVLFLTIYESPRFFRYPFDYIPGILRILGVDFNPLRDDSFNLMLDQDEKKWLEVVRNLWLLIQLKFPAELLATVEVDL